MKNKKGISTIVATGLLLVVAVVAIITLGGWHETFTSSIYTKSESKATVDITSSGAPIIGEFEIEDIVGTTLYVISSKDNLTISSIQIENVECDLNENLSEGVNLINISTCLIENSISKTTANIVLVGESQVSEKVLFVNEIDIPEPEPALLGGIVGEIGSDTFPSNVGPVKFKGNYAFGGSDFAANFYSFNITDSNNITQLSNDDNGFLSSGSINIIGDYAYFVGFDIFGGDGFFYIYNITDPITPVKTASLSNVNLTDAHASTVVGNYAYTVSWGNNKINIYNVTSKTNIVELDSYTSTNISSSRGIEVVGDYAYVTSNNRLTIFNISNPTNIVEINSQFNSNLSGSGGIKVIGDYAYLTSIDTDSLTIFNISTPTNIIELDSYTSTNLSYAYGLEIVDNFAYVASRTSGSLTILNISNPSNIVEVTSYSSANTTNIENIEIIGTTAYVSPVVSNKLTLIELN